MRSGTLLSQFLRDFLPTLSQAILQIQSENTLLATNYISLQITSLDKGDKITFPVKKRAIATKTLR